MDVEEQSKGGNKTSNKHGGLVLSVKGCDIAFPFEPYQSQMTFMEKMIEAMQTPGHNALLESPTGTGKTLCLLCASLGWRQLHAACVQAHRKSGESDALVATQKELAKVAGMGTPGGDGCLSRGMCQRIIYLSRTHGQLTQVIKELRSTSYKPKSAVLGSRNQLCIHPGVSKLRGTAQNNACQKLVSNRTCHYYNKVQGHALEHREVTDGLMDIEDLCKHGEQHSVCPYYLSRDVCNDAEVVFMPYNYLTDVGSRRSLNSLWSDSVIIFDEAHNLASICAEASSIDDFICRKLMKRVQFDLSAKDIAMCVNEITRCIALIDAGANLGDDVCSAEELSVLKAILIEYEGVVDGLELRGEPPALTKSGEYIFQIFEWAGITHSNVEPLVAMLEKTIAMLQTAQGLASTQNPALKGFLDALCAVFKNKSTADISAMYQVHVFEEKVSIKSAQEARTNFLAPAVTAHVQKGRTVGYWCFSAGVTMREIVDQGVRNIILASGTLSPMDAWPVEMQIPFQVVLQNDHVISDDQLFAVSLKSGPTGVILNSSFKTRDRPEYKDELGNVLVNACRVVPGGVLVFFPSYAALSECVEKWKLGVGTGGSVWDRVSRQKLLFVEPRESSLFKETVTAFTESVDKNPTSGAVLIAVCRGKMSEGIDFADRHGRAVIVTGIPFPAYADARVKLQRAWLDANAKKNGGLTGSMWYNQQAARAVNQAIGRVIRHQKDFGAIILCDERFAQWTTQSLLSKWIAPRCKKLDNFGALAAGLSAFFRKHKPPPIVESAIDGRLQTGESGGADMGGDVSGAKVGKSRRLKDSGQKVATSMDITANYLSTDRAGKLDAKSQSDDRGSILSSLDDALSGASSSGQNTIQSSQPHRQSSQPGVMSSTGTVPSVGTAQKVTTTHKGNESQTPAQRSNSKSNEMLVATAKQQLGKDEYTQFRNVIVAIKQGKKDDDKCGVFEDLISLLGRDDRRDLLRGLCGCLGRSLVARFRVYVANKHPHLLKLLPEEKA